MTFELSDRVQTVPPSGIRRFFEIAEERDEVISLGVGEPDFAAPWAAVTPRSRLSSRERPPIRPTAASANSATRSRTTSPTASIWGYDPDEEIIVTAGASEAVDLAFRAFVNPGDTVAIAQPSYISYEPGVIFAGGEVLPVPTREEDDFRLTVEGLERAGAADADMLVLCYPNNPTGAIMPAEDLEPIADFARENDLTVLSDEIYAELTYDGEHTSIASFEGMRERTIVFNGFSKAHAMTGLRLGYALGPADAIGAMNKIHQYTMLSAPTTAQYAAIEALDSVRTTSGRWSTSTTAGGSSSLSRFREIGMDVFEAKGAFYCFPEVPRGSPRRRSSPRPSCVNRASPSSPAMSSAGAVRATFGSPTRPGSRISDGHSTGSKRSSTNTPESR